MTTLKKYRVAILLVFIFISFYSCESEIEVEFAEPSISSFTLRSSDGLSDYACTIQNDTITGLFSDSNNSLCIPIIAGDFDHVEINGERVINGKTVVDFNVACIFDCVKGAGEKEKRHSYTAIVKTQNGIPRIDIVTEGGAIIDSKEDYLKGTITIGNDPEHGPYHGNIEIRGRGNATWKDYPKKPYKIKLSEKYSFFGFPANKDWVLLAEYNDKSFIRTALMCEVSKTLGMDYTINYKHVDLFINDEYKGLYILTDQVEKGKDRVNLDDDGFLIEDDNYYLEEPLFFTTKQFGYNFTFKYPKPSKGKVTEGDESYTFIRSFIDSLENSLLEIPNNCERYKDYLDVTSFARWYIATEVIGNWEPNLYYSLKSRNDRLKIGPMWDAEWSLGLAAKGGNWYGWHVRPYQVNVNESIWAKNKYFKYLIKDPAFVDAVKREWKTFLPNVTSVKNKMEVIAKTIDYSEKDNFGVWPILGEYPVVVMLVAFDTWEEEVEYALDFFDKRVSWLDKFIKSGLKEEIL